MRFLIYILVLSTPLFLIVGHDIYHTVIQGYGFEFSTLGFHLYHYIPGLFHWIKQTFIETSLADFINGFVKMKVFSLVFLITLPFYIFLIQAKLRGTSMFLDYRANLPELEKKWMKKESLDARYSGGKMYIDPHGQSDSA